MASATLSSFGSQNWLSSGLDVGNSCSFGSQIRASASASVTDFMLKGEDDSLVEDPAATRGFLLRSKSEIYQSFTKQTSMIDATSNVSFGSTNITFVLGKHFDVSGLALIAMSMPAIAPPECYDSNIAYVSWCQGVAFAAINGATLNA